MIIFPKKDHQNRPVAGVSSPNVCHSVSANKLLQGGGKFSQQNCRYKQGFRNPGRMGGYISSSVRRILKRGGQKFQKIWEEQRSESEVVPLKFSLIFRPNLGEEHKKKRSSLKFRPIFRPNLGEEQKKKKGLYSRSVPFSPELTQISSQKPESLMPNLQRGGGHASILLTLLCNFAILATQRGGPLGQWPPPKYAPVYLCQ